MFEGEDEVAGCGFGKVGGRCAGEGETASPGITAVNVRFQTIVPTHLGELKSSTFAFAREDCLSNGVGVVVFVRT